MDSLLQSKLSDQAVSEVIESVSPRSFGYGRIMSLGDVNQRSMGLDEDREKMKESCVNNVFLIW